MALAARLVSRSRQLCSAQAAFVNGGASQVRSYAKEAPPVNKGAPPADRPPVSGDDLLKGIFFDVKKKFETVLGVFKKEKVILDPDDPAAVARFAEVTKIARDKAGLLNESQKIKYTIDTLTQGIPDARTYLNTLQEIRVKSGLIDHLGIEPLMMEAVEKIEKDIKKPLLRSDKKNMAILSAEFDKINEKLGFRKEDLPKIEKELELETAKEHLTDLKKDAVEAMDAALKRDEFKDEKMPDIRTLDMRKYL